jgi:hypothetical protein
MSDRQLSLIDVQVGMYSLSLQTRLTPPCFQFFWGLIMMANTLKPRFKNPFDLTVSQAMSIGGGKSRQAVWAKQQQLKKINIDGKRLIYITAGDRLNNLLARYKINYDLIVPQSLYVPMFTEQPSKIIDEPVDEPVDDPLTILRSEERRVNNQITGNNVTTGKEPQTKLTDVDFLIKYMKEKWKLPSDPPVSRVNDLVYKYGYTVCVDAVDNSDPKAKTWNGKLDLMEKEYRDMVYSVEDAILELEAAKKDLKPGDKTEANKIAKGQEWIDHHQGKIDHLASQITEHGGSIDVRR